MFKEKVGDADVQRIRRNCSDPNRNHFSEKDWANMRVLRNQVVPSGIQHLLKCEKQLWEINKNLGLFSRNKWLIRAPITRGTFSTLVSIEKTFVCLTKNKPRCSWEKQRWSHVFGDWGVVTIWRGLTLPNAAPPIFIQISVERGRERIKCFFVFVERTNREERKKNLGSILRSFSRLKERLER